VSDASDPDDGRSSRRRLLALLGAGGLGLLGAGFGGTAPFDDDSAPDPDLSVERSAVPDRTDPTPTPTPGTGTGSDVDPTLTPTPGPGTDTGPGPGVDQTETPSGSAAPPTDHDSDATDAGRERARSVASPGTALPDGAAAAAVPPIDLADVMPGDGGVVDLSLSLSGTPARLLIRGTVTETTESGVTEPERSAGDDGPPGELQRHVRVRLWYDRDGGDRVIYEGPLGGLDALSEWTPVTDACVTPGTHVVRLRWSIPESAPNRMQTDSATFLLGVAADASGC
jgi:hypothetical protein